jgi:hypothetical protein
MSINLNANEIDRLIKSITNLIADVTHIGMSKKDHADVFQATMDLQFISAHLSQAEPLCRVEWTTRYIL